MNWKQYIGWRSVGTACVAVLMLVALIWGRHKAPMSVSCEGITYHFLDGDRRMYVEEEELNQLLRQEQLYPVGKPLSAVKLQKIEKTISNHPMVRNAECFRLTDNTVKVQLSQRAPLLRVVTNENETYFVDKQRKKMEARASVTDQVLLVKGNVGEELACSELADFAQWLQGNKYWRERVDYLYVLSPQLVHLYLKELNQPRIILGETNGFEAKLAKLRTFFENGSDATQNKQYKELDLRYENQVIGRE